MSSDEKRYTLPICTGCGGIFGYKRERDKLRREADGTYDLLAHLRDERAILSSRLSSLEAHVREEVATVSGHLAGYADMLAISAVSLADLGQALREDADRLSALLDKGGD